MSRPKRLAEAVKNDSSKIIGHPGTLDVYTLPRNRQSMNVEGCQSFIFGKDSVKQNRTIMFLGATGAGKSTLVNGMINYIMGVTWDDTFRFRLVEEGTARSQANSQTSNVTVYKLNHREGFQIDYSLTIIDTPGFGDTRGIDRDNLIPTQLKALFSATDGVSNIDAICFVAQASQARLTAPQKYVLQSMLSIFSKDVEENIRMMVTFADGQTPSVLGAINEAGVECPKGKDGFPLHFKFNNSALFADNKVSGASNKDVDDDDDSNDDGEDGGNFEKMFWNMGTKSMKKFFSALNVINPKSLTLTTEVLRQRSELENCIENIQINLKLHLANLGENTLESQIIETNEAAITAGVEFEYELTVQKPFQVSIAKTGKYITNCQRCQRTCHYPCFIKKKGNKKRCVAIGKNGNCKICKNKCPWNVHLNQKFRWIYKNVTEKRSYKELKLKYGPNEKVADILKLRNQEREQIQDKVLQEIKQATQYLNTLQAIALRPDPVSTDEYIDQLIAGEELDGQLGYLERIKELQHIKKKAEIIWKVVRGEKLL